MSRPDYRPFVPPAGQGSVAGDTPRSHATARLQLPRAQELFRGWEALAQAPFRGISVAGKVQPGLFELRAEQAPTAAMLEAARALLQRLSTAQRQALCLPLDSERWRQWQNTEIYIEHYGLRLDEVEPPIQQAAMALVRASLSHEGFNKTRDVMHLNRFLGDLVGAPGVLSEWAFILCLFGEPSTVQPWGWQLFGHHLSLNCLVIGEQMVLSPTFLGAEPAYADVGPYAGTRVFEDEERMGLQLMRSLSPTQQRRALVAHSMMGGDLPDGRRHFADQLHLGGAFQDNRIIPYEGVRAQDFNAAQRQTLLELVGAYIETLPAGPRAARLAQVEQHLSDTHFCWIGATGDDSPFYYRIQSPVILIEFDHHAGVFLTNPTPAKFHVHTVVRTPNGNDYGIDLLRQHYQQFEHTADGRHVARTTPE